MRALENISNKFFTQTSTDPVALVGGYYQLSGVGGNWNGAILTADQLMSDGSTWVAVATISHVNSVQYAHLPPGQYRLTVGTATPTDPVYATLCRVPGE
jgi:hypothetical protein